MDNLFDRVRRNSTIEDEEQLHTLSQVLTYLKIQMRLLILMSKKRLNQANSKKRKRYLNDLDCLRIPTQLL